jgi:hypothetical protein
VVATPRRPRRPPAAAPVYLDVATARSLPAFFGAARPDAPSTLSRHAADWIP